MALAQVTTLVAITQFQRFTRTGRGAGWCTGTADHTVIQYHIGFYGGIATGIEYFTTLDVDDFCHVRGNSRN
jgi:hypothetical protein